MGLTAAPRPVDRRPSARRSALEHAWWAAAVAAGAGFALAAILQSAPGPLLLLVAGLAGGGGLLLAPARPATARGLRAHLAGASCVADAVLVVVGVGHHPSAGLAAAAVLLAASPWTLRWISAR